MAVTPTYPGVYLSETASVPRNVTPATTNLTAFLGDFPQGSVTEAVLVTTWPEFVNEFGALSESSSLAAYGVYQFFQNGGIGAWILRLPAPGSTIGAVSITSPTTDAGVLDITADGPGKWSAGIAVGFTKALGSDSHVNFQVTKYVEGSTAPPPVLETIPNISLAHADGTPLSSADMA